MTIEMLDRGTILVSLQNEDMRQYALSWEDNAVQNVEKGLKNLLYHVGEVCGLDHRGKSYLIEALPSSAGCLLIISVHAARRRVYRVKRAERLAACVFRCADDMLDCIRGLSCGYRLYRYEENYVLLPDPSASDSVILKLSEFGDLHMLSSTAAARIAEFGKLLLEKSVQRRHISGRAVAVRDAALRYSAC